MRQLKYAKVIQGLKKKQYLIFSLSKYLSEGPLLFFNYQHLSKFVVVYYYENFVISPE